MSYAVNRIGDAARRGGRLERSDVGHAPSGTAARKIHDRDVVQGHIAQQVVGTKVQAQIFGGGCPHAANSIRFARMR